MRIRGAFVNVCNKNNNGMVLKQTTFILIISYFYEGMSYVFFNIKFVMSSTRLIFELLSWICDNYYYGDHGKFRSMEAMTINLEVWNV